MKIKKLKASGPLEFLTVFVIVFLFFLGMVDFALYFRQIYLNQTTADEILAQMAEDSVCMQESEVKQIYKDKIKILYNTTVDFDFFASGDSVMLNGGKFASAIKCKNSTTPEKLILIYNYKGLFMLFKKGVNVASNVSVNTAEY